MTDGDDEIVAALERIRGWGEGRQWAGYDPYDALNSPLASALSLGTALGRRLLTQAVKRSPINLRPALGVRPAHNAKAIGLVASAYAHLAAAGDGGARAEARRWLRWLTAHPASTDGLAWGYHFPVQTRVFGYTRNSPNIIATSFVAHAMLDGVELIGDDEWRAPASRAADFVRARLLVRGSRPYFTYLEEQPELVHNANLLGCAALARSAEVLGNATDGEIVRACVETSLAAQRPDGSWPYAEGEHGWIDNFHTAYVLESLAMCRGLVPAAGESLRRGVEYWRDALFLDDGTPKYTPDNPYPLDAHCYAQAVETWLSAAPLFEDAHERARQVAALLIRDMLHPRGYVRFERRRLWTNDVPFVRWSTAPAFRALARLLRAGTRRTATDARDPRR